MKRILSILVIIAVCILSAAGCSKFMTQKREETAPAPLPIETPAPSSTNSEIKQDTGRYTGQIDSNSIEIRISGVPDAIAPRAFRLSDEVKSGFERLSLKNGDEVSFKYKVNENNQSVITEIKRLQGVNNGASGFAIVTDKGSLKLMDWDNKVNPETILGKPVSVKDEVLGQGADTFTGMHVRTLKYDGLEVTMMSPKDNGKTFYVSDMNITSPKYKTGKNVKVGDSLTAVLQVYPNANRINDSEDVTSYRYVEDVSRVITFEVKSAKVTAIDIYNEMP